ncbi:amino acid adenylation domain-containing protein [Frankia gtarii]|uniref:amino acid adenylation domain-containing protein n=1 Tax=Frankia gtarii TaxID=2950102 RepID=UPI0021BE0A33|nr:amino acid adenylation domain-containing protein [Frankia gtarii]
MNKPVEPGDASPLGVAVEKYASTTPDALAVVDGEVRLNYRQVHRKVSELRELLGDLDLRPNSVIGISLRRSWRIPIAIAAVLSHGCTYVPLDPNYPDERLAFMARDSGVEAVIVDADGVVADGNLDVPTISMESLIQDKEPRFTLPIARAAEAGYIIYTSGSTGVPKGVRVAERGVTQLFTSAREYVEFTSMDVWIQLHSYSFDFSVWEIWGALLHGGRLVVPTDSQTADPKILLKLLGLERVTVLCQIPSAFRYLVQAYGAEPVQLSLRYLFLGGEPLDVESLQRWTALRPGQEQIFNLYGVTETTIVTTAARIEADDLRPGVSEPRIGKPLAHLSVKLVNEIGRVIPVGSTGEIYIAGSGVALGYQGRPDLTAERFPVLDLGEGPKRYYRSGDLARMLPNGDLIYLGRADEQVKIRGYRIELHEIDEVISCVHEVSAVATVMTKDRYGDPMLVSYYEKRAGADVSSAGLRDACEERLPAYMIPQKFIAIGSLPRTPSGKIDRNSLVRR